MKSKKSFTRIIVCCSLLLFSFAPPKGWQLYTSSELGFEIYFPGTPDESEKTIKTEEGDVWMSAVSYNAETGDDEPKINYAMFYMELPDSNFDQKNEKSKIRFERILVTKIAQSNNALVTSEKSIVLNDIEGKEYIIKNRIQKEFIKLRIFIVGNELYMPQITYPKQSKSDTEIIEFLDSFRFIEKE